MALILLVLVGIVAEIITWIFVGKLVGSAWYVFFWFIAAFIIGLNLLKSSTSHIMPQMQQMQMTGQMNGSPQVTKYLTRAIAGVLLMIPGLLTDIVAVLMLIPAVQRYFVNLGMKAMQKRQQAMMEKMMGGMGMGGMNTGAGQNPLEEMMRQMQDMQLGGTGRQDSSVIDGEAVEIEPERKRIDMSKKP